jgi:hypothetical protein
MLSVLRKPTGNSLDFTFKLIYGIRSVSATRGLKCIFNPLMFCGGQVLVEQAFQPAGFEKPIMAGWKA